VSYYDEQVQMFKGTIPIGPKPISELVELLETQVDLKKIALSDLPGHALQTAMLNATHCILNKDLQLKYDNMSFIAFQVIKNDKSRQYCSDVSQEKFIYVIFEKHTGYISSNSNRLFLELELARGVSQYEFDIEGDQFRSLLAHLTITYCKKHNIND